MIFCFPIIVSSYEFSTAWTEAKRPAEIQSEYRSIGDDGVYVSRFDDVGKMFKGQIWRTENNSASDAVELH